MSTMACDFHHMYSCTNMQDRSNEVIPSYDIYENLPSWLPRMSVRSTPPSYPDRLIRSFPSRTGVSLVSHMAI